MGIGLLGALLAYLVRKRIAFRVVRGVLVLELVLGAVCVVAGIIAVVYSQPFMVYYPLLLVGMLACVLVAVGEFRLRRHYREIELRKMRALDAQ